MFLFLFPNVFRNSTTCYLDFWGHISLVPKEKASIPTATTESVLKTSVTGAKQEIDVRKMGIPNEFSQTKVPQGCELIIMEIRRTLVDMLLDTDPKIHKHLVIGEG